MPASVTHVSENSKRRRRSSFEPTRMSRSARPFSPAGPVAGITRKHPRSAGRRAESALSFLQRAMSVASEANLPAESALWAGNLATAYAQLGEWSEAERFNNEATRLAAASPSIRPVYFKLNAAQIAMGRGDLVRAATLLRKRAGRVRWDARRGVVCACRSCTRGHRGRAAGAGGSPFRSCSPDNREDSLEPSED